MRNINMTRVWFHGLKAWKVFRNEVMIGHVVKESMGHRWAAVPSEYDDLDNINYWFETRQESIESLIEGLRADGT